MSLLPLILAVAPLAQESGAFESVLYDGDPAHPWNRVHAAICARELSSAEVIGLDSPFPLLWPSSDYLLEEARFAELLASLSGLVETAAETADMSTVSRVMLQGDLWALFDWAARPGAPEETVERRDRIARSAARAMRAVAPRAEELAAIADPITQAMAAGVAPARALPGAVQTPFLPRDLPAYGDKAEAPSPWILVADQRGGWDSPLAIAHAATFEGRSSFAVYLRAPEGREAGEALLASLRTTAGLRACEGGCPSDGEDWHWHLDPHAPEIPPGTMVALVQRMLAFDERGELHVTSIPIMIQVREFLAIPADAPSPGALPPFPDAWPYQAFSELVLDRHRLVRGEPALRALEAGEHRFDLFGAHGDEVEFSRATARRVGRTVSCGACHGIPGAHSINTYTGVATGPGTHLAMELRAPLRALVPQTDMEHALRARRFKALRYEWGVLRGMWASDG